jgi:hypothetical protein
MPEAVHQVMMMLSTLVAPLPIGTNLGPLHLLWMLVSGRLLSSRGALIPDLSDLGLADAEIRRTWAALTNTWASDALGRAGAVRLTTSDAGSRRARAARSR